MRKLAPVAVAPAIAAILPFFASCGGAGSAAKTPQEVGDQVVAALVAKDWNKLKPLYWNVDAALSTCSDMPDEVKKEAASEFAGELADAEKDFGKCLEIDWTGAKVAAVAGGDQKDAVPGCGDKVHEAKDIELTVEAGGKKYDVKVNDPVKLSDGYTLMEGIRCRPHGETADVAAPAPANEAAAPTPTEAAPTPTEAAPAADDPDLSGPDCKKYFSKITECATSAAGGMADAIKPAIDKARGMIKQLPADARETACKAALDQSKSMMANFCPGMSWE